MKPFDPANNTGPGRDDFGPGRVPDDLIDAILDGEVGPSDSKALFEQLRRNPDASGDLNATRRAIGALRQPLETPDFADRVLETVGTKRGGWLSGRDRRRIGFGRVAAAAAVVALIGGMYAFERARPGALDLSDRPSAVAGLASEVSDSSGRLGSQLASRTQQEVQCLGDSAFSVVKLFGERAEAERGSARVVFEWPFGDEGEITGSPRMIVLSDQPVSAASLAEQFSSITQQAGAAEQSLRPGGTLERWIEGLPKIVDRDLIASIGEFANSAFLQASNRPAPSAGVSRQNDLGSMPVVITLPGFEPLDQDEIREPE